MGGEFSVFVKRMIDFEPPPLPYRAHLDRDIYRAPRPYQLNGVIHLQKQYQKAKGRFKAMRCTHKAVK